MNRRKKLILVVIVATLVVGGGVVYAVNQNKQEASPGSNPSSQDQSIQNVEQPGVSTSTSDSTGTTKTGSAENSVANNGAAPLAPSGTFVSNHRPSMSSSANQMNSVCKTSAGATCEIRFTMGGTTKVLGPNAVGQDGSISWDWKLQDIGLAAGTWKIEAVARANGKSTSTIDSLGLEVSQ